MNLTRRILSALPFCFYSSLIFAQGSPGNPGGDPGGGNVGVPIDGGVTLLVMAAVGYGAKKIYDRRKREAYSKSDKVD